jgi:hypothetical protein
MELHKLGQQFCPATPKQRRKIKSLPFWLLAASSLTMAGADLLDDAVSRIRIRVVIHNAGTKARLE